ncbi:MAG: magnesium protoporphyrin IX methyltransferase [Halochromatium sp.]|uniref:magnesium protoporphyrin IX methyltransferase n=1 Tax=Halochromatium sp. TaxID=2049430 RepID=UPI00397A6A80
MPNPSYQERRDQVESYFDRTAAEAWKRLTSDAPVSGIRATVRAGRERMRAMLLDWLPADLSGKRLLDAGCGTGLLSVEAARRGAEVYAVDLSPTLIAHAREHVPSDLPGRIEFAVGDMLAPGQGDFDHIVAMDSIIHYEPDDALDVIAGFAERARVSVLFTFAPRTPALAVMHAVGQWFPRSDRSPAIVPIAEKAMRARIQGAARFDGWEIGHCERVAQGFYTSQALELRRRKEDT